MIKSIVTPVKPHKWTEDDDEFLLNQVLFEAQSFLKTGDLMPKDLNDIMTVIDAAMRRKRINGVGYDAKPVAEIIRSQEASRKDGSDEEKLPIASLHPDTDISVL